uniref:Uncharacterized protein n=1 Tax=Methylophaga nitratireducenticrescens TaxID=754476 RepID=I1XFD1_METNJ
MIVVQKMQLELNGSESIVILGDPFLPCFCATLLSFDIAVPD